MPERQVNDAIRSSGAAAQAVEIVQGAGVHLGPRLFQYLGTLVGSGQAEDLMAALDEFVDYGRTDKSSCSSHKNTHKNFLLKDLNFSHTWSINYRVNSNASFWRHFLENPRTSQKDRVIGSHNTLLRKARVAGRPAGDARGQ